MKTTYTVRESGRYFVVVMDGDSAHDRTVLMIDSHGIGSREARNIAHSAAEAIGIAVERGYGNPDNFLFYVNDTVYDNWWNEIPSKIGEFGMDIIATVHPYGKGKFKMASIVTGPSLLTVFVPAKQWKESPGFITGVETLRRQVGQMIPVKIDTPCNCASGLNPCFEDRDGVLWCYSCAQDLFAESDEEFRKELGFRPDDDFDSFYHESVMDGHTVVWNNLDRSHTVK